MGSSNQDSEEKANPPQSSLIKEDDNKGVGGKKPKYPISVFFIIGNEFCERFSYYGMKTVLTLYLTNVLLYNDDFATMIYHTFSMACYFTPIFGAMIADSLLGKFRTIFYISIIYVAGNILLSVGAIPRLMDMVSASMAGLALIAIGTGGIKPCVAAFGGDQFGPGQEKQLQRFFSLFYMSINAGSLLSTIITPFLREDVKCFGDDSCFSLAFGVPAVLMAVALVLFLIGRPMYKIVKPSGNVVIKLISCVSHALHRRLFSTKAKSLKKTHWLDYADDKYDYQMIKDIKILLRVLWLYLPLPIFWALFDQQGSRWTLQATRMNGELFSGFRIKPDQMQVINPLLILAFIPLFEYLIYPLLAKCHLLVRPLQRITCGGILAACAFVITAFVQMKLEATLPDMPLRGHGHVAFINTLPCTVPMVSGPSNASHSLNSGQLFQLSDLPASVSYPMTFTDCRHLSVSYEAHINDSSISSIVLYENSDETLQFYQVSDSLEKPAKGESNLRIIFSLQNILKELGGNDTFMVSGPKTYNFAPTFSDGKVGSTDYQEIESGAYNVKLPVNTTSEDFSFPITVQSGGSYILVLTKPSSTKPVNGTLLTMVEPNTLSMFLQIPQFVVMTAGEIMFSITGLEFSYSQAPASMKSVVQAAWLLTVAFGNLIVVIVANLHLFEKQSYEFLMFSGLMILDILVFAVMAYFYKPSNASSAESEDYRPSEDKVNGVTNVAYTEDTKM